MSRVASRGSIASRGSQVKGLMSRVEGHRSRMRKSRSRVKSRGREFVCFLSF